MTAKNKIKDVFYIIMMALPVISGILINILTKPADNGINISGARIFFEIKMPLQPLYITESQINAWLVIISVFFLCLYLTNGISEKPVTKRQHFAELFVSFTKNAVNDSMGKYFKGFPPFVGAIILLSAFSSLISLTGMFPPTSDLNVVAGWAILVFILITYYKFKCGPVQYVKSFGEPVAFLAPLNIISEFATPVSMAFRHYGNILSGSVISVLVAAGLQGLSAALLGWLPGFLGKFPFLQIGLPAVLSVYFDLFSGILQAYIFAMLTMLYVGGAFPYEKYMKRKKQKSI